jgi:hypothetical protein
LQAAILDRQDAERAEPLRDALGARDLARLRFEVPLVLVETVRPGLAIGAGLLAAVGVAVVLATGGPSWEFVPSMAALFTVLSVVFALAGTAEAWEAWRTRTLVLDAEGMAIGPDRERARRIPWDDVRLVRRERTSERGRETRTSAVEVLLRGGERLRIHRTYGRSLDDLVDLIDPPLERVAAARAYLAEGVPPAEALDRAGLSVPR